MLRKPIWRLSIYLFATLIIYILLYATSENQNMLLAVLVASIFMLSFLVGGLSIRPRRPIDINEGVTFPMGSKSVYFLRYCCIALIVVSIVNVFTVYSNINSIFEFIQDPGKAYVTVKQITRYGTSEGAINGLPSIIGLLINAHTFSKYAVLVFGIAYWKEVRHIDRFLVIISIFVYIIHSFLMGAMINIAALMFVAVPFMWLQRRKAERISIKRRIRIIAIIGIISVVLMYFLGTRYEENADRNFISTAYSGFLGLLRYISHGYIGFAESLELPWKPTFGFVSFRGLTSKLFPNTFNKIWVDSYLYRNETITGRPALQVWSTIFPWLASDFSYFSIPLIMFFVGRRVTTIWFNVYSKKNPFALLFLTQFMVFVFMIPANNQLFHTFGNATSLIICAALYHLSKKKYEYEIEGYQSNDKKPI